MFFSLPPIVPFYMSRQSAMGSGLSGSSGAPSRPSQGNASSRSIPHTDSLPSLRLTPRSLCGFRRRGPKASETRRRGRPFPLQCARCDHQAQQRQLHVTGVQGYIKGLFALNMRFVARSAGCVTQMLQICGQSRRRDVSRHAQGERTAPARMPPLVPRCAHRLAQAHGICRCHRACSCGATNAVCMESA